MSSTFSTKPLPVHFFSIVLNGEPFIRYHIEAFRDLPFPWHWHIVEGIASLVHDTAWSVASGGRIDEAVHFQGRSMDGTSQYLDEIAAKFPDNITLYRKPPGEFWEGKRDMVNAPLANLPADCLLWQVDADELWTRAQICTTHDLFVAQPQKTAAWFWCHYFVGPHLVVSSRDTFGQHSQYEWQRVWRYRSGMSWASHEPPRLVEGGPADIKRDVAAIDPFLHHEMESHGLVFQHFAYVLPKQLQFKESYYGYKNALEQWRKLQRSASRPLLLKNYFSWVTDDATADSAEALGVVPIAQVDSETGSCRFLAQDEIKPCPANPSKSRLGILIEHPRFRLAQFRKHLAAYVRSRIAPVPRR